jgi:hypothetical protein
MQEVYGDTAQTKSTVYNCFLGLRMDRRHWKMTSTVGSFRHSTLIIEKVRQLILPSDLKMGLVSAKFVLRQLTISCAAIPQREKHSYHHPTTILSGSLPERLLTVPYSETGPQGDTFHNHGGHKIK